MSKAPKADEFGRLRVRDKATGHERSIRAESFRSDRQVVVNEPASEEHTGVILPPKFSVESVEPTTTESGQQAEKKENGDG